MYCPETFRVTDAEIIRAAVRANPLATVIANGDPFPYASALPLQLSDEDPNLLIGHMARDNEQVEALRRDPSVLAVFQGPHGYISAYAKEPEKLSLLPTWDYQIVHARGTLRFVDGAALERSLVELVDHFEADQPRAMAMEDYPRTPFEGKMRLIIGFEIDVSEWAGCFRLNQNRTPAQRENIKRHLEDPKLVVAIEGADEG